VLGLVARHQALPCGCKRIGFRESGTALSLGLFRGGVGHCLGASFEHIRDGVLEERNDYKDKRVSRRDGMTHNESPPMAAHRICPLIQDILH
jgi:hypothetical protein